MKKNRIKAYWLLLLVLLYAAGAVLSVGEAQARYVTTATWNTVVQQEENSVTSDCLVDISAAPLTILLGTMSEETYPVSFHLTAGEDVSGNLTWEVDPSNYVSVQMHIGDTEIKPDTAIEIAAGETVTVVMTLIPSETAFTEVRDAVSVSVTVTWADTLRGKFLTQLPAVVEEPTEETEPPADETEPNPSEPEEPTEPQPSEPAESNPTEPNPSEPTEPQPTNPTEPAPTNPTEPTPTDPTEPTPADPGTDVTGLRISEYIQKFFDKRETPVIPNQETSGDETIPEEEATQPVAETEPVASDDPDGQSEETPDPSEPEVPGDGTGNSGDTSESSEDTTEEPAMDILLEAVSKVNSAEALPIQITASQNGGMVRLGIATVVEPADPEGESQTVLEKFPRYTRFSLTDGASYFMLYDEDTIALELQDGETLSVLLDLSYVSLEQMQVVLGAASQSEDGNIVTYATMVIPKSTQYTALSSRILSPGTQLEITVSEFWKDYSLEYTVEMLGIVPSENGETVGFVVADLPEGCLNAEFISDATGTKLIFTIGDTLPPAGTYRVSLNWTFEEVCYAQTQEIFFINYLAYTESEETGGAEQ